MVAVVLRKRLRWIHHNARKRLEADANSAVAKKIADILAVKAELNDKVVRNGEGLLGGRDSAALAREGGAATNGVSFFIGSSIKVTLGP